ncbi:ABC transporter permease [Clostridium sardiniense]|uniref:ABC transporter permease n=1 Tax=Clostridium sardiniense TaxID=29369 RepID=A0ABS7KTN8_CLOSR|nr:ABC transporter permease subunit [Clostridium sardiniense]MBY0754178.1 ABC transporter permease [Clostridium sardiniense]MDQ0459295.1 ABC-2 type transport system permease protein [Clostridium sardiniense]
MISLTLFKRDIKSNYKIILLFFAILTLYSVSVVYMYDPTTTSAFEEMAKSMPELMKAFGMASVGANLTEYIANYLYGLIILMFPIICIIILGNKLIASYVDRGSMAYLLATPNKRVKIALTQAVFMWLASAVLLIYASGLIIFSCNILHGGALDVKTFILMNVVLYFLHVAVSGICFFASCISNDTKLYFTIGAGVPVLFYLLQALANMGGKLENLKYFTLFTFFNTGDIIAGEKIVTPILVLLSVAIVLYGAGIYIFSKRDLSL